VIKLPKKKYTPKQDVQLGKEAASEVRKQYPIIEDQHIAKYLTQIGNRLVAAAPTELKQSVYEYSFTPVNLKDINAFALPGGPMFVQRGMFDAAAEEAEVAGVMAHELSRVLLRHGTANASKAPAQSLARPLATVARRDHRVLSTRLLALCRLRGLPRMRMCREGGPPSTAWFERVSGLVRGPGSARPLNRNTAVCPASTTARP
jgi:predicted Zn-dependent protease